MSHKPSEAHYVEGVHRFWIDEGYVVCRIECSGYYARQAQRRRERQKALEEQSHWGKVREVGAARVEEKIPQWKQRLRQRLNGETANHEGRRRKRKRD